MRLVAAATAALCALLMPSAIQAQAAQEHPRVLFIGNSFTYGEGSAVHFYRSATVTDLNRQGNGGVPALFKSFTNQAGLPYDVYLETQPGSGLEFHLAEKKHELESRVWQIVVAQGQSTLDLARPGDATKLVTTARQLADLLHSQNPGLIIYLVATWPRADQTYKQGGKWYGKPLEAMASDVRAGYDRAAAGAPGIRAVIPLGEAWIRAIRTGVADANPYDGIDAGKLDLWTHDQYHASTFGYYLEALMDFGAITGRDPRSLGEGECSAYELGISPVQAKALQEVAYQQLTASHTVAFAPAQAAPAAGPHRCAGGT